ncbi:magnesium transporter CorA family protein [Streptococcus suis]|uniref:magnesium transporter CorA family protein n=1 Tax=Streptococcus parasuis TaxID=1501662 RepID=UPI000406C520|nr:magnesium transporter CorA family protein [Streptococcus suis]NQK93535.1 magnesium transporter CorA family protein [Streptococcus suis]HEM3177487.1 magnesium transporter CorA family protein [Streptococcus suis]HEM3624685.1 magnesium transporter CorA family protein [Streptococcus suis]
MIEKRFGNNNELSWIIIHSGREIIDKKLVDEYDLDNELISYALDKNERAHLEYNVKLDRLLLIFNLLDITKEDNYYETTPMAFIVQQNQFITIFNARNAYFLEKLEKYLRDHPISSCFQFLFAALTLTSKEYFPILDQLESDKDILNSKLRKRTTKQLLLELSDLETGLVYFLTAGNQNVLVLEQLRNHPHIQKLGSIELEELDDALIEARQLVAMTQLDSQILQQLSGAYNNILNNNLNDTLTILTIISILLAVLAVITGFFGMNVQLPWQNEPQAWIWIVIISLVLLISITTILNWLISRKN